jgi:hypothetical protein
MICWISRNYESYCQIKVFYSFFRVIFADILIYYIPIFSLISEISLCPGFDRYLQIQGEVAFFQMSSRPEFPRLLLFVPELLFLYVQPEIHDEDIYENLLHNFK